jgi:hypothetical protein
MDTLVAPSVDLVEWYYEQGYSDGLPVVPPTPEKIAAMLRALGGEPDLVECRVPPRWGNLTRRVLAINLVMAGCRPAYAPVVRAAMLALTTAAFNLNGVQATTHMAAPLLVVNGPIAREIGMNAGGNCFGSGNRANATIAIPGSTRTASPRTRERAPSPPTTSTRGSTSSTRPCSCSPPSRRTA